MKKVLILLLKLILVAPSCKKEPATIEGKWHMYKSTYYTGPMDARVQQEKTENSYYEFTGGTVKITNEYGYIDDFSYTFDQDNSTIAIGNLKYAVDKFNAKEMVWSAESTTVTVINGTLTTIVESNYYYFKKE